MAHILNVFFAHLREKGVGDVEGAQEEGQWGVRLVPPEVALHVVEGQLWIGRGGRVGAWGPNRHPESLAVNVICGVVALHVVEGQLWTGGAASETQQDPKACQS